MVDIVSGAVGLYGLLKLPFQFFDEGFKLFGDLLIHIKATHIAVPGEEPLRRIRKKERVQLPPGTKEITLRGWYLLCPQASNYVVLVSKREMYWAHGPVVFRKYGWDAKVTFGDPGTHFVTVARLSPDLMVFYRYYHEMAGSIAAAQTRLKESLPKEYQSLADDIPNWTGTTISAEVLGLKRLQEVEFVVPS